MSCGAPAAGSAAPRSAEGGQQQSHEEDDKKVRRREKNRVAAQRSRKKQTQKADKLHEVPIWTHDLLCQCIDKIRTHAILGGGDPSAVCMGLTNIQEPWNLKEPFYQTDVRHSFAQDHKDSVAKVMGAFTIIDILKTFVTTFLPEATVL
ncbi:UNVERIFIED_CONTAM: hypothetical protein H355_015199 [Colinus virginianus]|nr:hypothetical protein H355_015199 [Colinus virginianus]